MGASSYAQIYDHVINNLLVGLSEKLTYHCIDHTLDVLEQAQRIAEEEGIGDENELFLLKTAALYHDTGFLYQYKGHEEAGYSLAKKFLPDFGVKSSDIERIGGMIMATRLPQSPHNKMEEIICDADLDYLGRNDFFTIAQLLFKEMNEMGIVESESHWNQIQVSFIKNHRYFTGTNQQIRDPQKIRHCKQLEQSLSNKKE